MESWNGETERERKKVIYWLQTRVHLIHGGWTEALVDGVWLGCGGCSRVLIGDTLQQTMKFTKVTTADWLKELSVKTSTHPLKSLWTAGGQTDRMWVHVINMVYQTISFYICSAHTVNMLHYVILNDFTLSKDITLLDITVITIYYITFLLYRL